MFGEERSRQMRSYLLDFAARAGVRGMVVPEHKPNTRRALALAEHARDHGRLHEARTALMNAYWREGQDIEEDGVLAQAARASGLDPGAAIQAIAAPAILERVDEMGAEAARAGVTGIPTFVIGGRLVVGAQPYDVLAGEAEAAGARRRREK
jgi:predicted DsbA family dithiol-disulfide isomerase